MSVYPYERNRTAPVYERPVQYSSNHAPNPSVTEMPRTNSQTSKSKTKPYPVAYTALDSRRAATFSYTATYPPRPYFPKQKKKRVYGQQTARPITPLDDRLGTYSQGEPQDDTPPVVDKGLCPGGIKLEWTELRALEQEGNRIAQLEADFKQRRRDFVDRQLGFVKGATERDLGDLAVTVRDEEANLREEKERLWEKIYSVRDRLNAIEKAIDAEIAEFTKKHLQYIDDVDNANKVYWRNKVGDYAPTVAKQRQLDTLNADIEEERKRLRERNINIANKRVLLCAIKNAVPLETQY